MAHLSPFISPFSEVQLGAQGCLVIRAALRKALNLNQGDHLAARKVGDSLVLERRRFGLSLADRACLGLAIEHDTRLLTADSLWSEWALNIEI